MLHLYSCTGTCISSSVDVKGCNQNVETIAETIINFKIKINI